MQLERVFYYEEGLDIRPSFHHVLYEAAPWHTDKPPLPGLRRSLEAGNWTNAKVRKNPGISDVLDGIMRMGLLIGAAVERHSNQQNRRSGNSSPSTRSCMWV